MTANGGLEEAECNVQRDFGGGKGAVLRFLQAWRGRGSQGGSEVWYREVWTLVY